jgi:hypothetical protein
MHRLKARLAILTILASMLLLASCNILETFQPPEDKAIVSEVQAKLFEDPVLKTRDIRVTAEKGVVTLVGTVATELEKAAVERFASRAKGTKQVVNQLAVVPTTATAAPAAPAETPAAATAAPETSALVATTAPASAPRPAEQPRATRRRERAAAPPTPAVEPTAVSETAAAPAPAPAARAAEAPAAAPAPVRQPEHVTIPAGTVITVRMIDRIDSSRNRPGEEFAATIDAPVVVDDRVVIRRGADARVRLVESRSAGRMTGRSELHVELVGLAVGAQSYLIETGMVEKAGASRGKRTAETVGGGAVIGTLLGAIVGKGKGAAIGGAIGAGAGTAVQASTKGEQVQIPPETKLDFTLRSPLTLTM